MERIKADYAWATTLPFWLQMYVWFACIVGWSTVDLRTAHLERLFIERDAAVAEILTARVGEDVARIIASMSIECTTHRYKNGVVHIIENHTTGMVLYMQIPDFMYMGYPSYWNFSTRYQKYWQLSYHYDNPAFTMPTSMYCRWLNTLPKTSKKHIPLNDYHLALLLKGR